MINYFGSSHSLYINFYYLYASDALRSFGVNRIHFRLTATTTPATTCRAPHDTRRECQLGRHLDVAIKPKSSILFSHVMRLTQHLQHSGLFCSSLIFDNTHRNLKMKQVLFQFFKIKLLFLLLNTPAAFINHFYTASQLKLTLRKKRLDNETPILTT
jgi:hypothetical protein